MFTCASCTIEACRSGQLDKMPKNCPMRDRAFFDSILEEYFKPENHDFFIASAATETANSGHIIQPPSSISPTGSSFTKTALPAGKYPCR